MMKIVIKTTKQVMDLRAFLNQFKNINTTSLEPTQELVESLDENAILVTVDEPPSFVDKFELVELSEPIFIEGKPTLFWQIKRLGRPHINDYFNDAVEDYIDAIAKERGWKNQDRLLGNLSSTNPNFQQEARYMRQLIDLIWAKALPVINTEVDALVSTPEKRPMSVSALLSELPTWSMPDNF